MFYLCGYLFSCRVLDDLTNNMRVGVVNMGIENVLKKLGRCTCSVANNIDSALQRACDTQLQYHLDQVSLMK